MAHQPTTTQQQHNNTTTTTKQCCRIAGSVYERLKAVSRLDYVKENIENTGFSVSVCSVVLFYCGSVVLFERGSVVLFYLLFPSCPSFFFPPHPFPFRFLFLSLPFLSTCRSSFAPRPSNWPGHPDTLLEGRRPPFIFVCCSIFSKKGCFSKSGPAAGMRCSRMASDGGG